MNYHKQSKIALSVSACLLGLSATAATAGSMPEEKSLSGFDYELLGRDDIYGYGALDSYGEAPFLTEMVAAGTLPPLAERLPKEPIVFSTAAMVDGIGEYGGVFRHVIGGRPEGWNWVAGQHQGWGGINMAMQECLTRQGPRWQIKGEDQTGPLPNLAQSWEWNDDNTQVTMQLMQGVKWSDGDAFDTEDVRFWWEDNVQDENVSSRITAKTFGGSGTTMEVIDDYSFSFTFEEPQSEAILEGLAYIQGCPGPSHILKDLHPTYNAGTTYEAYTTSQPSDVVSPVVLGAWVPVIHKPDELVVMRRNPFYFKVDEKGQQLPYYNEMHFRLSTWGDRTVQTVAGTGDFSNMEDPANYVESAKQSQTADSPVKVQFGPRVLAWRIDLNFDVDGAEDEYGRTLRTLFREKDFRIAMSHSLDRDAMGQSVARGPFSYPFMGGFATGSPFYDKDSTDYQAFDPATANALFDALDLKDTDGNNIRNLPGGGADIEIDVTFDSSKNEELKMLESATAQFADVGIRLIQRPVDGTNHDTVKSGGTATALLQRRPMIIPTREVCDSLPSGDGCPYFSKGKERMGFEQELADAYAAFLSTGDAEHTKTMQALITENAYTIGLIQVPAALLINKRIKNAHPGTPVFMYEWAEDGVIRERLWTAAADQQTELFPKTVPQY